MSPEFAQIGAPSHDTGSTEMLCRTPLIVNVQFNIDSSANLAGVEVCELQARSLQVA